MTLTIVVGSGRCGSTLLSRILREHPSVLSISEFFATLTVHEDAFPSDEYDGEEMWKILSASDPYLDALIRDGLLTPELCYPYDSGRFNPETGVPLISHMTLPMLTDDPDALFDELGAAVTTWPRRPAADHYRALFAFLGERYGRHTVVERSGASLNVVSQLRREFPEARFVHMHRAGPDTALSMSKHAGFRLNALAQHAAKVAGVQSKEDLTPEHMPLLPDDLRELFAPPFNAQRFAQYEIPEVVFGEMWSSMQIEGLAALAELPDGIRTDLRYETLMHSPDEELTRLAAFLGVPADPGWLETARGMVDPGRIGQVDRLSPERRAALEEACRPGTEALAAALSTERGRTA